MPAVPLGGFPLKPPVAVLKVTPEFEEYLCIFVVHSIMMSSSEMVPFWRRTSSICPLKYSVPAAPLL